MNSVNDAVTWELVGDGILQVTMNRAPANALGPVIIDGLNGALDFADEQGNVKVVVVTSVLDGIFAAGADIKHMAVVDAETFTAYGDSLRGALDRLAGSDRIAIAAIDGLALGGGLELAMACTLRVATPRSRLGLPEVKLGLIPGAGGTQRLPRLVGRGRAIDIMITARQVPGDEALAIGLVDRTAADGSAADVAVAWAKELVTLSHPAQMAIIRTVDAAFDLPLDQGFAYEIAQEQDLFEMGEAREGISAFLSKRSPNFS